MSLFNYYPYINYDNIKATHLLVETEVVQKFLSDYNTFFKYTLREGDRADMVAYDVYGDSSLDWVIYMVNRVVDPYKDWLMDDKQFKAYMEAKYNTTAERLNSTNITTSIAYYYYEGLNSDSQADINSYNYNMSHETYTKLGNPSGWTPVSVWEYEYNKNEEKREINLLKPAFITDFKQQLKDLLNNG